VIWFSLKGLGHSFWLNVRYTTGHIQILEAPAGMTLLFDFIGHRCRHWPRFASSFSLTFCHIFPTSASHRKYRHIMFSIFTVFFIHLSFVTWCIFDHLLLLLLLLLSLSSSAAIISDRPIPIAAEKFVEWRYWFVTQSHLCTVLTPLDGMKCRLAWTRVRDLK